MIEINIAKDFSPTPGGRYINEGPDSGELFRETLLIPKYTEAVEKNEKLRIILDGCFGFPSSFIDESFGGLARKLNDKNIFSKIEVISNDQPSLIEMIKKAVEE